MEQMGAFLPLILIFAVFYILLIRPQQKKIKLHKEMINNLQRKDKIITSGGIIGKIVKVEENKELIVEISENVEIRVAPGMITDLYEKSNESPKKDLQKNDQDLKSKSVFSGLFNKKKNN